LTKFKSCAIKLNHFIKNETFSVLTEMGLATQAPNAATTVELPAEIVQLGKL